MVGLIWMVQIVHYKMFDRVGEEAFRLYATDHARLITPIVALPMLVEIVTAVGLLVVSPPGIPRSGLIAGVVLVFLIWLSTAFLQVPCHDKLAGGFDTLVYEKLVSSNWVRTIGWSLRGALMGYFLWKLLPTGVQ